MSSTPSSASRINATTLENAFPTPPTGDHASDTLFRLRRTASPVPKRMMAQQRAQSTPPEITHANQFGILTRSANAQLSDVASLEHSWQKLHLSKKKSQYYSEAFAYREPNNTAKDRIAKDSVVLAEIKLNCCVRHMDRSSRSSSTNGYGSSRQKKNSSSTCPFGFPRSTSAQRLASWP
jgi:hypothetical protein